MGRPEAAPQLRSPAAGRRSPASVGSSTEGGPGDTSSCTSATNRKPRPCAVRITCWDRPSSPRARRRALIRLVSADSPTNRVRERPCPQAVRCADPFHVVQWATDALDEVRRQAWNLARGAVTRRRAGRSTGHAKALKGARYALWKNPENLTGRQQAKLAWIAKTDPRLHRAYLLKEGLRLVFSLDPAEAPAALDRWIGWARRCRIEAFVQLQRRIVKHRATILAALEHGLSNGRIESVNTKIRLLTRIAFGFNSPDALIALAMLTLGGHPPLLPGRA